MTECVILYRNPNNRAVGFLSNWDDLGEETIAVFENTEAAEEVVRSHVLLQAYPYQIIELDEL